MRQARQHEPRHRLQRSRAILAGLALLAALPLLGGTTLADPPVVVGGSGGGAFVDPVPAGSFLVGFACTLESYGPNLVVRSVRPIHGDAQGSRQRSALFGEPGGGKEIVVLAPAGFAVGGLRIKGGDRVDGFAAIFMKIEGDRLSSLGAKE